MSEVGADQNPALVTGPPVATATGEAGQAAPVRIWTHFGVWLRDLIISLAISAFIIIFLYQPVKVEGTSMMPSLEDQERIFVNKFVYRLGDIHTRVSCVLRYAG